MKRPKNIFVGIDPRSKFRKQKRGTVKLNTTIMSWSISFIGKPEKVVEALEAHSNKLSDYSKVEYDKVLPSIVNIIQQNFGFDYLVKVDASGHGHISDGVPQNSQCKVNVDLMYGVLV
jgi:hypothetical protein